MPLAVDVPHGARLAAEGARTHHGAGELLAQQLLQPLGQTGPGSDQVLRAGHESLVVARVEDEQRSVHVVTGTAVARGPDARAGRERYHTPSNGRLSRVWRAPVTPPS